MPTPAGTVGQHSRFPVLDGWRALSILLVIAAHWAPLDAVLPGANEAAGAGGMALFFTLSGFLITQFLLRRPDWRPFLIRRVARIVPLAWLAVLILFAAAWWQERSVADPAHLAANLLFYGNLPAARLLPGGEHLWSLAVEMHFYLGAALLAAVGGRRALLLLPAFALAVTAARVAAGETISIVTWHRVDEILAGATLALVYFGAFGERPRRWLAATPFWLAVSVAGACTFFIDTPVGYARPYGVAWLVGVSLFHRPEWVERVLVSRPAAYIAHISYALYVWHGMFGASWLVAGDTLEKYAKRPLLIAATWAAAHWSTYRYEQRFTEWARRATAQPLPAAR